MADTRFSHALLKKHYGGLHNWMREQSPQVIGARDDLILDLTADGIIYLLQPTRVIARKRIEKGVELILALLQGPLRAAFEHDLERQLVLHVTGPTPEEHQADLETILHAYGNLIEQLPPAIAERVFLAFSGGNDAHPSFDEQGLDDLNMVDIYRMATAIRVSQRERGARSSHHRVRSRGHTHHLQPLPAHARLCRRDWRGLPRNCKSAICVFRKAPFRRTFSDEVVALLLHPEDFTEWRAHNRRVIRLRYGEAALRVCVPAVA